MAGIITERSGARLLSFSHKISRFFPPKAKSVALVFDESPCVGVTESILAALSDAGAKATFVIYGSTAENCPGRRGRRYIHLPAFGREGEGGAEACPELVKAIASAGHELACGSWSMRPAGKVGLISRRPWPDALSFYRDNERLLLKIKELTGATPRLCVSPQNAVITPDERSIYEVYSALGTDRLYFSGGYAGRFFQSDAPEAEAKRIVRSVAAALKSNPSRYNGAILRFCGGLPAGMHASAVVYALPEVLRMLKAGGYSLMSVAQLRSLSPFQDVGEDDACVAAAKLLVGRGQTVTTQDNELRCSAAIRRSELYAMLTPRRIMQDYMRSRLLGGEPAYPVNERSEKEFYMSPGRVVSAGMFYGYAAGWPLDGKYQDMTSSGFRSFLQKAAPDALEMFTPPKNRELCRRDIFPALELMTRNNDEENS